MAGVNLHHIFKVYDGGVRAVNDFDLEIKDKEFIVFVGPSGCGKSTTLRMIAGLEDITAGQLYIDGELVNDVDSKNRDIAMVFQSYALYPHMTVYDNMAFGLKLRHIPKVEIDKRVKSAAKILEISDLLTRKPKALSGGQRQRVALGRTIVREPKVFLLDEPLSNLDAKLRVAMRSEITKLYEKLKTTFIYVTHDQTEAMTMGSRIVVMKDGFIQQADTPITLFEDPCNLFVATFLGSPQMNILKANLFMEGKKLKARLLNNKDLVITFPEIKAKQLVSESYIGKEVLIGIRPENILINKGNLKSFIEVVEHLGDETILYTKIKNNKENFIIKTAFNGDIKSNKDIKFDFDMNRIYMFDKDTQKAIMGIPHENIIPIELNKSEMKIGKQNFELDSSTKSKLLDNAFDKGVKLSIKPDYISITKIKNSLSVDVKIEFKEDKTDYQAIYFSIPGVKGYFALKAIKGKKFVVGNKLTVYFPLTRIKLIDKNNDRCDSREVIYENKVIANVKNNNKQTIITFGNSKLVYPLIKNIKEGKQEIILDQSKLIPVFTKKMQKQGYKNKIKFKSNSMIKVDAYDEDVLGNKNIVYVKINGFEHYASFVIDNTFSVYKMPQFEMFVPVDAVKFK